MAEGYVHPDFGAVSELLQRYTIDHDRHGGAVAVYHRGEKVVDVWAGNRDAEGTPWTEDTMAMSFSTTKGVAATALHVCADRDLVDYDEPVATYWPEFAAADKGHITVRHLLTHTAGLHRIRGLVDDADEVLDWDAMVELLAGEPAHEAQGQRPGYHGITFGWLVGEVVRRVSGVSLGTFVRTELAQPLELDGLHIGVPDDQLHRVADLLPVPTPEEQARMARIADWMERRAWTRPIAEALLVDGLDELLYVRNDELVQAEVPAMNGTFTARSLARLYAALANGGELDGARILSPETVATASRRQGGAAAARDLCIKLDMRWRLGYHEGFTLARRHTAYGHFGYGGSGAWADPELDLAIGFVTNDLSRSTTPFADIRMIRLGTAAVRAARRR